MMLWTAFLLGVLGSLHCVSMCGPIVLALPKYQHQPLLLLINRLLYNTGRIVTYSLMGLIVGFVGEGFGWTGLQQSISIVAGSLIIVFSIFSFPAISRYFRNKTLIINQWVKQALGKYLKEKRTFGAFMVGFANGFLPCGLVYLAIGGALAMGGAFDGLLYMTIFGAGTSIAMLSLGILGNYVGRRFNASFNRFIPYFAFCFGVLLVLRGMDLGIPYVSPQINDSADAVICH